MPLLEDKRQEQYAKYRAKGILPTKAAVLAGYSTGSSISTKLEADEAVLVRIQELIEENVLKKEQQRAAARASGEEIGKFAAIGRAWVLRELAENAAMARLEGKFADSTAALTKIGEEFGMFKGSTDPDKPGGGNTLPSALDFDALNALTDKAHSAINPSLPAPLASLDVDEAMQERAFKLIEGNGKRPLPEFNLETEANVAFTEAAIPPLDEEDDLSNDPE